VKRLLDKWRWEFYHELRGQGHDELSADSLVRATSPDWRPRARAEILKVRTPRLVVLSKETRAENLSARIDALQRDLAAFKLSHGGGTPELDAQVLAWLEAISTET
jgi:hypothetical protein